MSTIWARGGWRGRISLVRLAVLVPALLVAASCSGLGDTDRVEGSGVAETRSYDLTGFDRIEIGSAFEADVTVASGERFVVEVTTDGNLFDEIEVEVDGSTLRLGAVSGVRFDTSLGVEAIVVLPSLIAVEASGASKMVVEANDDEVREVEASGASRVSIADVDTDELSVEVSGASSTDFAGGVATTVDLSVSGASEADLSDLSVDTATVDVSGASDAGFGSVSVVSGDASGASTVRAPSSADVSVETSGASTLDLY